MAGYYAIPINYVQLFCGLILLTISAFTGYHIYKGSRAEFAITLIAFTTGFALYEIIGNYLIKSLSFNF
jgi:hypothetical protein